MRSVLPQEKHLIEILYFRASKITCWGQKHHLLPPMQPFRLTAKAEKEITLFSLFHNIREQAQQKTKPEKLCY